MINKLMKYDFKWINKILLVHYIILLVLTITVKIVESFEQNLLLVILDKIVSGLFIAAICSLAVTCLMRTWDRITRKFYRDESYLTHTLPVTKNQLFNSVILAGIVSLIIATIVIFGCLLFTYINEVTIDVIKNMFQSLFDVYGKTQGILFVISLVLIVFLETIYFLMSGVFGLVLGHRSNNHKMIKSITIGLVTYGVLSLLSLGIVYVVSNIANFEVQTQGFPEINTLKYLIITGLLIYLGFDLLLYFVSKHILNKGVNVD